MKKDKNKNGSRNRLVGLLLLLIVFISVGFAYLSGSLDIVGTAKIKSNSWDVYFSSAGTATSGSVTPVNPATISNGNDKLITFTLNLDKPGEFYEFSPVIKNGGTINAKLKSFSITGAEGYEDILNYKVTYSDGTALAVGNTLQADSTKTLKVRVELKKDISADDLLTEDANLNLAFQVQYEQAN